MNVAGRISPKINQQEERGTAVGKTRDDEKCTQVLRDVLMPSDQLLEFINIVTIPATTEPFAVREKFVVGTAGIAWLSDNFKTWFLGKAEEPAPETSLRYAKLTKSSLDGPILAELGDKAETTLAQIYALIVRQANGEEGALLTNGYANIFYVDGRAVSVRWYGGGWSVHARSVADPRRWGGGRRVFSRNS